MVTARVRCSNCRQYIPREDVFLDSGVGRFCSSECVAEKQVAQRESRKKRTHQRSRGVNKAQRPKKERHISLEVRAEVRERDKNCRWCGGKGTQIHHVRYRSEGGPDTPDNLLLLCTGCHERAHSSKQAYQEVLLLVLWAQYAHGKYVFVSEAARALRSAGLLTELQLERFFPPMETLVVEVGDKQET